MSVFLFFKNIFYTITDGSSFYLLADDINDWTIENSPNMITILPDPY